MMPLNRIRNSSVLLAVTLFLTLFANTQQTTPSDNHDGIRTVSLPIAIQGTRYQFPLKAQGGNRADTWVLVRGELPKGIRLFPQGLLDGTPSEAGDFHFVVALRNVEQATESHQQLTLHVAAPLFARWERYPRINGQRIEGSIKVSNSTDNDFDLTFITVAVNDIGRAQALGYQRFNLRKNTTDFELPFGENVPVGSYKVHVDVVAEVAATRSIYRQHLETDGRLVLRQTP